MCNGRRRGEKKGGTTEAKMQIDSGEESSPLHPEFIFSRNHWGPAARLSPACRNAAECGISFSVLPLQSLIYFPLKERKNLVFHLYPPPPPTLTSSLLFNLLFPSANHFIDIQVLRLVWSCNHLLPSNKIKTEMKSAFPCFRKQSTRTTLEYKWVLDIFRNSRDLHRCSSGVVSKNVA